MTTIPPHRPCAPGLHLTSVCPISLCLEAQPDLIANQGQVGAHAEAGTLEPVEDLERFVLMDSVVQDARPEVVS